jgi:nucleoside-diphosphate-sugar epimerase
MAYLVTGGTGYIGSYVVRDLLSEGKQVVCFQRSGITDIIRSVVGEDKLNKVKIVQGDVSDTLNLFHTIRDYNIDMVVHLGGVWGIKGDLQPDYTLKVNCIGMNNILEAARLFGLKKIVWTGSNKAFGRLSEFYDKPIVDDDAIYMPDSMYGTTKVLNEFMTKLYFEKFGIDVVGLRMGLSFGIIIRQQTGGPERFNRFLKSTALNMPTKIAVKDADRMQNFSYAGNVSNLIVKACNAPTTKTRIFNIPEYKYSLRQLVEVIRKVNPQARITIEEGVETEDTIWQGAPEAKIDCRGVQTELGWKPKYSLEESVKIVSNYFRQQEGLTLL